MHEKTMLFEDKRQIGIFVLVNVAVLCANGQNYAERGDLHTGIIQDEDEEDLWHTENYDWSQDHDDANVWRWNVEEYPHPKLSPRSCNRMSPSNVCDPDRILIPDEANKLDIVIRKLYNDTSCICDTCNPDNGGIQVGVALLKNTFQPYIEHQSKVIRSFAKNLRSKWRLGKCEDDILIVLATDDRQSYTDVGSTASKYISREEAYMIFQNNKAYFSKGQYYEGLLEMLKAYQNTTKEIAKRKDDDSKIGMALISGITVVIVIIVGVLIVVAVILYRKRRDRKTSREPKYPRSGWKKTSWRPKEIKSLLSPFRSSSDSYQPCKTQEEKQKDPDNRVTIEEYGRNDEEILNLNLAEPEPQSIDTPDAQTTADANHKTSEPQVRYDSDGHDEVDVESRHPQITEPSDPSTSSPKDPSTSSPKDPSTSSPNDPSTSSPNDPSTSSPNDPSTSSPSDPLNSSPNDPSTSSPSDPSNSSPNDPSNSSPNDQDGDVVIKQFSPMTNTPPTFYTFVPKSQPKELHQTDL